MARPARTAVNPSRRISALVMRYQAHASPTADRVWSGCVYEHTSRVAPFLARLNAVATNLSSGGAARRVYSAVCRIVPRDVARLM